MQNPESKLWDLFFVVFVLGVDTDRSQSGNGVQIFSVKSPAHQGTILADGPRLLKTIFGDQALQRQADFAGLLKDSVGKVNEVQQASASLQAAFEAEDPNVDLAEVMVAMQKSSLSFQAMTSVRNKLVSAYQEIMSMPV